MIASRKKNCQNVNPLLKPSQMAIPKAPRIIRMLNTILFPISPQIALIGVQGKPLPIHLNASTFLSKGIKLAIIQNALMYIYSTIEDPDIPSIRPRTVDIEEYNRIMRDLKQWHNSYMSTEGNYNMNTSGKT